MPIDKVINMLTYLHSSLISLKNYKHVLMHLYYEN